MDARYLWWALGFFVALGVWEYLYGFNAMAAFLFPFVAVVLLFLFLLGDAPVKKTEHWISDEPLR